MTRADWNNLTTPEIFEQYNLLVSVLREKGVIRTQNIVGEYGEWLVSQKLKLKLVKNSSKGFDAVDTSGKKYQIKTRRLTAENTSDQLSSINNLDFDYLIAVLLREDFSVQEVRKVPFDSLKSSSLNLQKILFRQLAATDGAENISSLFNVSLPRMESMADSLAEYIGVFDSSKIIPGGLNLSKNTGQKAKELMVARHRGGKR